ncbi:hypothetical protein KI387_003562, partial [Taxus chinensis]
ALVEVSVPFSMAMVGGLPVEVAIGSHLPAAVTLKSTSGHFYSRCDAFNYFVMWQVFGAVHTFDILNRTSWQSFFKVVEAIGGTKMSNNQASDGPLCAWTLLRASQAGKAIVHASVMGIDKELLDDTDALASLKASWSIAAYASLVVQQAGDGNSFGGYKFDVDTLEHPLTDVQGVDHVCLQDLLLVPGSGMTIFLHGGPERWQQGVDFFESYFAVTSDGKIPAKGSIVVTKINDGGGRMYWVSCHSLGNFTLQFKRGNLIGDDHPLPALAEVELLLVCSYPSSITVIADEPANTLALIRATSQADRAAGCIRVTPVIVTNGRTIRVAAVGIHQSGRPFANSSSLFLKWALTGCEELAFWVSVKNGEKEMESRSWERFLVLHNESGQCIVRATVREFSSSKSLLSADKGVIETLQDCVDNVLTDAVRLQLVSAIRIEPDIVVLFFHPDAKASLSIYGGTSNVEARVNDTRVVVVVQYPPSAHYMHLILGARGLGTALVTVQDTGLASRASASALARVVDVDWIKIILPEETSVLLGSVKDIEILAGTHDGHVFDSSQIEFMNVHVHTEDEILELVDSNGIPKPFGSKVTGSRFFIRGANIGLTTTLHVSALQGSGREILSQFVKVEVYAPLLIHPSRLFLAPGATYTLTVNGGPRAGVVVEYSSVDISIASVESASGELVAGSLGNTSITARVYNSDGEPICDAYTEVIVGIPSSMKLNFVKAQLGVGHEMSVFPKSPEGDLFSFYEVCRNYKWMIGDEHVLGFSNIEPTHVQLQGISTLEEKGQCLLDYAGLGDAGFATRIIGRSGGRSTVSISFSCDFSAAGNIHRSVSYSASDTIWVVPNLPSALGMPITWLLPPFYTTSDLLPEWTEPSFRRDSRSHKGHVIYSILKANATEDEAISIQGGRIKTSERNTIACIEAKDRTTGRFDIAACVRVAEVSQLTAEVKDFPFHVVDLSAGFHQLLDITYHDNLGIPFFEAQGVVPLFVETNHPDIVSVKVSDIDNMGSLTNTRLYLQALQEGRALVRIIFQKNQQNAEYILIRVGAYISPRNPVLHVGGHLNFSITRKGVHGGEQGHWSSMNEGVVIIDNLSGEARAVGEGYCTSDYQGHSFRDFSQDMGVSYDCLVDPPYVGYCKPWKDSISGMFYCLFIPHSPEYLAQILPGLKDRTQNFRVGDQDGRLHISITAVLRGAKEVSGSADAIFIVGFSVLDMDKFDLTRSTNKSRITIVGNVGGVKLRWQARDFMSVSRVNYHDMGIGGRAEYEVKLLKRERFSDKLEIILPATGQRMEIDVNYEPSKFIGSNFSIEVISIVVVVSVISLVLTIIIYLRLLDQPEPARQNFSTEPAHEIPSNVERTPVRTQVLNSMSLHTPPSLTSYPRTPPQPYTEYIRRTVDDTPLLRKDGRKRFDPSFTY